MAKSSAGWAWRDVPLDDLLAAGFEAASLAWRGPGPVALVLQIPTTAGTVRLVHLMSPKGQVHWAMGQAVASRSAGVAAPQDRAAVAQGLSQALRRSAVPALQRRLEWLRTLYAVGGKPLSAKVLSLCSEAPAYRELGPVASAVVFESEWTDFVQEQDALLAEAGPLAFLGSDERVVMLGADDPTKLRTALFHGFSPIDFSSRHALHFELSQRLLRTFERELRGLEAGQGFTFQMETSRLANPVVNLRLPLVGSWELEQEPLLRQLLACRARLSRRGRALRCSGRTAGLCGRHGDPLPPDAQAGYGTVVAFEGGRAGTWLKPGFYQTPLWSLPLNEVSIARQGGAGDKRCSACRDCFWAATEVASRTRLGKADLVQRECE